MKHFLIGMLLTAAMICGWEAGEWLQAQFGLLHSFALWGGVATPLGFWLNRKR